MGIEEGTFWHEHWVLYGNQFDNKFHNKIIKNKLKIKQNKVLCVQDILCQLHGNQKGNSSSNHTKEDDKELKTYLQQDIKTQKKRAEKEKKEKWNNNKNNLKTIDKMATVCTYLSIITSKVNRLNSPIKRQRLAEWIKKNTGFNSLLSIRDSLSTLKTHMD